MVKNSTATCLDAVQNDVGPLAWVFNELRKSLEAASKALKRFTKEADSGYGSDLAAIDVAPLRIARQQIHQAFGALEMVGLTAPASLLHAMENAVQKFVQHPELCSREAAATIEFASFALTDYLQCVLAGKPVSAVSLFPQYRDVQERVRAGRIHPADLWSCEGRWLEPQMLPMPEARIYGDAVRALLDQWMLQLMKGKAPEAADRLREVSQRFAAAQTEDQPRVFWLIAAGFFEAIAHNLLDSDLYVRRTASRVLLQYASLSSGDPEISPRLSQDLLFFCAQATPACAGETPALSAVRLACGLARFKPVDYELIEFGRFDPAQLAQARRRIVLAKDGWSLFCAGDITKAKQVSDQFSLVVDALRKLHPASEPLAQALSGAIAATLRRNQTPALPLAMEVATSVLYLEAAFDDLDPADPQLAARTTHLAQRLQDVVRSGELQPLDSWMEELYRRVSDPQTLGSVGTELRVSLAELERGLDTFFRNPADKTALQPVPGQLSQVRGVLSVLGLDDACRAVVQMKGLAEQMLGAPFDETRGLSEKALDRFGNNLGVLSFLIDMLNYQPALVKKLFVYDERKDELTFLMGLPPARDRPGETGDSRGEVFAEDPEPPKEPPSAPPLSSAGRAAPVLTDCQDDDLRAIFLEEAREVVGYAGQALRGLESDPDDPQPLAVLRRAFHMLKGSARMVEINELGEASWAMEQLLNSWLAEGKTVTSEFCALCCDVLAGLQHWIDDIAGDRDGAWSAVGFCRSARIMQTEGRCLKVELFAQTGNGFGPASRAEQAATSPVLQASASPGPAATSGLDGLDGLDFDSLFSIPTGRRMPVAGSAALADWPSALGVSGTAAAGRGVDPADEPHQPHQPHDEESEKEEPVKVIDGLRIGIQLYNVYLNEADEWSRRLVNEIAEWSLESHQVLSPSTVALAHSLAGSSATVGFTALSELARALEQALDNSRNHHPSAGAEAHRALFVEVSEEIRRLLHQFAAGFQRQPAFGIVGRLAALEFFDFAVLQAEGEDDGKENESCPIEDPATAGNDLSDSALAALKGLQDEPAEDRPAGLAAATPLPLASLMPGPRQFVMPTPYDDVHDDIDAVDVIDPDLFPIFEEECAELMPRLGAALRQWGATPSRQAPQLEVLRVLHTLKGSARLAGALRLGEMAHRIESEIALIGAQGLAGQEFEFLLTRFDGMQNVFEGLRCIDSAGPLDLQDSSVFPVENQAEVLLVIDCPGGITQAPHARSTEIPGPQAMVLRPLRQAANATIRVRTQLLDRMVNQAGEVMISRSRLEAEVGQLRLSLNDMTGDLTRLRQQLRDIELQAETQMQSRLALAKDAQADFDPLEFDRFTRVQELTRMMAESVNDVATVQRTLQRTIAATEDDLVAQGRQARELQRDLLRTRMVEFESVSDRLYRVVRQTSKETGKQVRLDLHGGSLEMDRGMLDRMIPALEHLLRNCISHGVEAPHVRVMAGKAPVGLITLRLRQEGNDVLVELNDDGAGLDLSRIRERGIRQGLVPADQVMEDNATASLIFLPGFSTSDEVTELAGRGIGLDVVRSEVISLGGRISTSTVAGKGTGFAMVLPLTTAVTQVVLIRAGSMSVGVPASVVENVRRTSAADLAQAYRSGLLDVNGEAVPFFWSGALLQTSYSSGESPAKTTPVVIFRSADQRVALHVDEVLGNREAVVKNLGPQLSGLPGLTGMSTLPSGAVVLIYNPVALAAVYGAQARAWSKNGLDPDASRAAGGATGPVPVDRTAPQAPLILVVDDSITVRRVTQRLLLRDGYRVALAADGLQALERLQEEIPAVVLSDIEMPRMDGFDLARNIRADPRTKDLPIIMITSRIAGKHNDHALELGVDHYLGKPYSEDELLRLIRQYCSVQAPPIAVAA